MLFTPPQSANCSCRSVGTDMVHHVTADWLKGDRCQDSRLTLERQINPASMDPTGRREGLILELKLYRNPDCSSVVLVV